MKITFAVMPMAGAPFELKESDISWLVGTIPEFEDAKYRCRVYEYIQPVDCATNNAIKIYVLDFQDVEITSMREDCIYLLIELHNKRWMDPEITAPDNIGADVRFDKFLDGDTDALASVLHAFLTTYSCKWNDERNDSLVSLISGDTIIQLTQDEGKNVSEMLASLADSTNSVTLH